MLDPQHKVLQEDIFVWCVDARATVPDACPTAGRDAIALTQLLHWTRARNARQHRGFSSIDVPSGGNQRLHQRRVDRALRWQCRACQFGHFHVPEPFSVKMRTQQRENPLRFLVRNQPEVHFDTRGRWQDRLLPGPA